MMKKNSQFSPQQIAYIRRIATDPVLFAIQVLGTMLWEGQVEILRSIAWYTRTAVKACHAAGKTYALAVATLWWLARYEDGIVLITSPTQRQVRTQIWSEIHRIVERARIPFPESNLTGLKFRGDSNFAIGFSTDQAENFQGYHGKNVLIIADEAPGIESSIWDAIAGTMAGGKVHLVMAGNPVTPFGAFFDAFTRNRNLWNCITIDAFDTPNLKGLTLENLLELDPTERGRLDQNPFPYLVTKRWTYDQHKAWFHENERSSPSWMSRVRAQFPEQAQNALVKLSWLERAKQRALQSPVEVGAAPLVAGVDVGAGEAETVVYVCERNQDRRRIIAMGAWRAEDTRGQAVNFLNQFRSRLFLVQVDAIGVGLDFGHHLSDCRFPVELVNVAHLCASKPELGEDDPSRRFLNLRACYYKELADAFKHDLVDGLTDETTIAQLAGLLYEFDSQGRMKIEAKEEARKRGVPSPDRADALMLALGKPYQKFEYLSIRDLQPKRSRSTEPASRANNPFFGFADLGEDDGDDGGTDPDVSWRRWLKHPPLRRDRRWW
jgi:phage terminase large subunit